MKSQLFLFLRISITKWLSLRVVILTFIIYFNVIIRATDRVWATHWVHNHPWRSWVTIVPKQLYTAFPFWLPIDLYWAKFRCLMIDNLLIFWINNQKRVFFFIWRRMIKLFTYFWMRWTKIINYWISRCLLLRLCLYIWTTPVFHTPWCCTIDWLVRFSMLLAGWFNKVSIKILREWLLHLCNIHLWNWMWCHLGVIWMFQTSLAPQVSRIIFKLLTRWL